MANMKDPNKSKILPKDPFTTKLMAQATPKLKRVGTAEINSALSAEFIIESDDDRVTDTRQSGAIGSGSANTTTLIPPTAASPKPKPLPLVTKAKNSGKKQPPSPDFTGSISGSSENDSSRKSSSESESGADSEGSRGREAEKLVAQLKPPRNIQQPIQTYKPPNGFGPAKITLPNSSALPTLFPVSGSNNTQVWHITVPATVPIDAIQKTSLARLLKTETLLSYKGSDYGFVQDPKSSQDKKHILLPNARESWYASIPANIGRTLHLRQLVQLPNHTSTSRRNGDGPQEHLVLPRVYTKFVRQQPEGLRMRYRPFGDKEMDFGEFSSDYSIPDNEEGTNAQFRLPPGLEKTQLEGKRISTITSSDDDRYTDKKRRRKNIPEWNGNGNMKQLTNGVDPSSIAQVENPRTSTAKEKLVKKDSGVNGVADDSRDGGTKRHSKRTSEERTAQKEEKGRTKEQERIGENQVEPNVEIPRKRRKRHRERVVETP